MWIFIWRGNGLFALLPLIALPALIFIPTVVALEQQQTIAKSLPFFTERFAAFVMLAGMLGGWFIGGVVCFILGLRWNREENYHHLYFIPVQYLGLASCLLEIGLVGFAVGFALLNK